ncbi:MAG: amidohydrolase family protein [Terriglobia bacterium]
MNRLAVEPGVENHQARSRTGTLRLTGARVALDAQTAVRADVVIKDGRIREILPQPAGHSARAKREEMTVDLPGYLLLPGLINAHDHLEFNLFPRLGSGPYANFRDWAGDIFRPDESPVREHLGVPKRVRLWWGAIKNLLCGVTTVCHHNPYDEEVFGGDFPVRVVSRYGWAHSLALEKDIAARFRATPEGAPFLIHLAEGTDQTSAREIFTLHELGALDARTVIIHAVGLDARGRALVEARGAGIVWCPSSNLFTLGKTLSLEELRRHRRVALGSDSALTGAGDLLDEMRLASHTTSVGSHRLYGMVTEEAARVLQLGDGEGRLEVGSVGDVVAVRDKGGTPADILAASSVEDVELTIVAGNPQSMSDEYLNRFPSDSWIGFSAMQTGGVKRWVRAPLARLFEETSAHLPLPVRLAGRSVMPA